MRKIIRILLFVLCFVPCAHPRLSDAATVKISIKGVRGDLKSNVESFLSLETLTKQKDLSESVIRYHFDLGESEIEQALQPFGYYRPEIQSSLIAKGDKFTAEYRIDSGPAIPLRTVEAVLTGLGKDNPALLKVMETFPLAAGDDLNHGSYEKGKAELARVAYGQGYLKGSYTRHEITVDLDAYRADIHLEFETGPQFLFGPVRINQDFLNQDLVEGYVNFEEGDPLNFQTIQSMQATLRGSPYFSRVEVEPNLEEADSLLLPIDVTLSPSKKLKFDIGVGFGTDEGFRVSGGVQLRRINRWGHRADAAGKYSGIDRRLILNYVIPFKGRPTSLFTTFLSYGSDTPETYDNLRGMIGVSFVHLRGKWQETFSVASSREEYTVGVDMGVAYLTRPIAQWTRVIADDRIYTTRGYRLNFQATGAIQGLGSSESYAQGFFGTKGIYSLGFRNRGIVRGELGYTTAEQFRDLPPTARYFAGGAQSVRGYGFQTLGPRDELGQVIGGPILVVLSAEYEFRLTKSWSLATFYDRGNALDSFRDPRVDGAGFGIRWLSPVGLIRVDHAWALSEDGTPTRIHIMIGPDL